MNSTQDVVIPGGEAEEDAAAEVAQIAAVVSKPKRTARSRELASLLENITNLAPSPVNSSDSDSSDDASVPRRLANRPKSGKANKRFSAPQVQPSAATATLEHLVTVSDAAAKMEPPFSCGPCAPSRDADDAGQSAGQGNSCDKMHPEQSSDPLHNVASYRCRLGDSVEVSVTGASGVVYGDIVYADDSNLAAAAVHAGLLSLGETKSIRIYILGPYKGFVASFRNDIKSHSYPQWPGSFAFAPDALEQAAAAAAKRKLAIQERRAAQKAANAGSAQSDANSSDSDGNGSSSGSDSEPVAAHWDTPAVPEHLQALAESGMLVVLFLAMHMHAQAEQSEFSNN